MTGTILRSSLDGLGLTHGEIAGLLDVDDQSVAAWATGKVAVPGPVAAYLRLLRSVGPEIRATELSNLRPRPSKLDEGIYALSFRGEDLGSRESGAALAVLRDGRIMGSDRGGALFTGHYEFDTATATSKVRLKLSVPAEGALVNGFTAGAEGAVMEVEGAFRGTGPVSSIVVAVAGRPIELELAYLGPLPN